MQRVQICRLIKRVGVIIHQNVGYSKKKKKSTPAFKQRETPARIWARNMTTGPCSLNTTILKKTTKKKNSKTFKLCTHYYVLFSILVVFFISCIRRKCNETKSKHEKTTKLFFVMAK